MLDIQANVPLSAMAASTSPSSATSGPATMTLSFSTSLIQTIMAPTPLPPTRNGNPFIFLAGSAATTSSIPWRSTLVHNLSHHFTKPQSITILNPYRSDWDSTWTESPDFAPFAEQVSWELHAQERADIIAFYFDPDTQAPISLLELGLVLKSGKCVVCCPERYWKWGNVALVCERWGVEVVGTLAELGEGIVRRLEAMESGRSGT